MIKPLRDFTQLYHVAYYDFDQSLYLCFKGCNFNCKGCVRKKSLLARYEVENIKKNIPLSENVKTLNLGELEDIVILRKPRKANLGGFEPTVDPFLRDVIGILNDYNVYTVLLTNGYLLDTRLGKELIEAGLKEVMISIKAYTNDIFEFYTGKPNMRVLNNFRDLKNLPVKLKAESVLIPGLVENDEIERIARFVASVDPSIPFRVDAYDAPDTKWKAATPQEIVEAVKVAEKYLKNVSCRHCESTKRGKAFNVYP